MGDKIRKVIREAGKTVDELVGLALKLGTLFAVVKLLWDSFPH